MAVRATKSEDREYLGGRQPREEAGDNESDEVDLGAKRRLSYRSASSVAGNTRHRLRPYKVSKKATDHWELSEARAKRLSSPQKMGTAELTAQRVR